MRFYVNKNWRNAEIAVRPNLRRVLCLWRRIKLRRDLEIPACSALANPSLATSSVAHAPTTGLWEIPGTARRGKGVAMRSDKVHRALAQGINRFEVCQLTAKGVKATHVTGTRFEDTINTTLDYLGAHQSDPALTHPKVKPLAPAA